MSKPITRAISVLELLRRIDHVPPKYIPEVDSVITALKIEDARTRLDPSKRKRRPATTRKPLTLPRPAKGNDGEPVDADQGGVIRRGRAKPAKRPAARPAKNARRNR